MDALKKSMLIKFKNPKLNVYPQLVLKLNVYPQLVLNLSVQISNTGTFLKSVLSPVEVIYIFN